jgi:hypothetical protein
MKLAIYFIKKTNHPIGFCFCIKEILTVRSGSSVKKDNFPIGFRYIYKEILTT